MKPRMKTIEVTLSRTIAAPPAEVFDAWLDPANPGTPWHGQHNVVFDPRVGSLFYFKHVGEELGEIPHFGRFLALDRGRKIELTWMSPITRGLESIVTVVLKAKGDDTLLTLRHANLPDDEMGRMHEQGWSHYLGLLEAQHATQK